MCSSEDKTQTNIDFQKYIHEVTIELVWVGLERFGFLNPPDEKSLELVNDLEVNVKRGARRPGERLFRVWGTEYICRMNKKKINHMRGD